MTEHTEMPVKAKRGRPIRDMRATKTAFVTHLLDPNPNKPSQREWAREYGIDPTTLSDWKSGDPFVLELLKNATAMYEPIWAQALATLASIATDRDHISCVQAIRELGKLMKKYPSEKVDVGLGVTLASILGQLRPGEGLTSSKP
jgi:hypothetical protein